MVMKQYDWINWTRLKTLRAVTLSEETGLPLQQSEIARIAGMSQAYYSQIEKGIKHRSPKDKYVKGLATAFGFDEVDDFLDKIKKLPEDAGPDEYIHKPQPNFQDAPKKPLKKYTTPYNPKELDETFSYLQTGVLLANPDLVEAPPYLNGVENAYCLVMPDEMMEPRYRQGDVLYVNPEIQPIRGDDVVVQLAYKDRVIAVVGELVAIEKDTPDAGFEEPNPAYGVITLQDKTNTQFFAQFAELEKKLHDENYKEDIAFDPFSEVKAKSRWYIFADPTIYSKPLINGSDKTPIRKEDGSISSVIEIFRNARNVGAKKEHLGYIALAIHPIVGTQRWRF